MMDLDARPMLPRVATRRPVVAAGLLLAAVALSARLGRAITAHQLAQVRAIDWAALPDAGALRAECELFLDGWRSEPCARGAALFDAVVAWRGSARVAALRAEPFDWQTRADCGHG
jgi:hypothetical protein